MWSSLSANRGLHVSVFFALLLIYYVYQHNIQHLASIFEPGPISNWKLLALLCKMDHAS